MTTAPRGVRAPTRRWDTITRIARFRARQRETLRAEVEHWRDEREDLATYIPAVHRTDAGTPAHPPAHLGPVIDALSDDSLGHTLIIAPPGSAKTNTLIAAVCWWLGRDPTQHVGYFSNTATQAARRSVAIRDTIARNGGYHAIFPDTLRDAYKGWSEEEWYLQRPDIGDKDPSMLAAGVGGAIMGARLDRAVCDDIADDRNMATANQRARVIAWLQNALMTRLTPRGRVIMIATRWHTDDPAAWAIAQGWHVIRIPAVTEEEESYWPERWPVHMLACPGGEHGKADPAWEPTETQPTPPCWVRRDQDGNVIKQGTCAQYQLGSRQFSLVYQGETSDDSAAIFKRAWWRFYNPREHQPPRTNGIVVVDLAHEEKTEADFTTIGRWYHAPPRFYLTDMIRRRMEFPEVLELLRTLVKGPEAPWRGMILVIEETPGSKPLIQTLKREIPGVIGWSPSGRSKLARANATVGYVEAGNVWLPEGAPWVHDFVEEHVNFRGGNQDEHDDQVDNTTLALLRFTRGGSLRTF